MIWIFIGNVCICVGISLICGGLQQELDKKMENKTGFNISVRSLTFGPKFTDEFGNKIPVIHYLGVDK